MSAAEHTRPSAKTRETEKDDALVDAHADNMPTRDEQAAAERTAPDENVAREYKEASERGANQKGEGRLP